VAIEVIKERRVGLPAPKRHIGNLKVVINCLERPMVSMRPKLALADSEREGRTNAVVVFGTIIVQQEVYCAVP
jgi:hypothetical protein